MTWNRFFRRAELDEEVARELQFHLESEIEDNVARGMAPGEARAAALRKLGNPSLIREEVYRMNTIGFLETILQDLRYAFRVMRLSPGFTATAILTLAIGIGANTAVFTVIRGVLLKPLDYADPQRLVRIAASDPDTSVPETVDFTTTVDWRTRSRSFASLSLYRDASGAIFESGKPELLDGMRVNYDYFDTLGVKVQIGRTFLPEEDRPDRRHQVILTHGLWVRRFGGDPEILGRVIRLSDSSYTVVGVLPRGFRPLPRSIGSVSPEIYMPLGYALNQPGACRGCQHLRLIGRLKPGVSVEHAREELNAIMRDIVRDYPGSYARDAGVVVTPLHEDLVARVSKAMWVLLGAVIFVLLIACANVANLVLVRTSGRRKEIALRVALGAGRPRLVRQLLFESLLLAFASALLGLLLAWAGTSALLAFGPELPRSNEIELDSSVLWFTIGVSLLTVVLFGAVPALKSSRVNLSESLKDSARSTGGRTGHRFRNTLVIAELALAFLLLMGAGLLGRSFLSLTTVNPGYDPHNVLTAGVYVYGERYQQPDARLNYYNQVMQRLRATPAVASVALVSTLPMASFDRRGFHIQEFRLRNQAEAPSADTYSVSPDYFHVMRIPLQRGRFFSDMDRRGSSPVAIISESCARTQFPNQDPIGKRIQLGGREDAKDWLAIVGVVGDVRQYGLDQPPKLEAYIPQAQDLSFSYNLVARTTLDPRHLETAVRNAFLSVDRTQPIFNVRPLEAYISDSLATRTFSLMLAGLFGALALLLAAIGIYGVISYAVTLRTGELGIRMALGAERSHVLFMVLRQGLTLVAIGLAVGFGLSLALTRFLSTLLFEVRPTDLGTSIMAALGLAAVALLATYLPARRATRIDPTLAFRIG